MDNPSASTLPPAPRRDSTGHLYDSLMLLVLLVGLILRGVGLDWGEYHYLHPDERFLVWVGSDIQPISAEQNWAQLPTVESAPWRANYPEELPDCQEWGGYFDASCSPLNPNNRGHSFYVYGTLPMFAARYVVEWLYGHSGFNEMTNVGRALSALVDLLTVFLVYLVASRNYDRRVGLLAAAFSACVVMQIQLSHYFTMDTFANFFTLLAIYYAVRVSKEQRELQGSSLKRFIRHPYFLLSIGFGVALGSAVASKLNAVPVAVVLPAAFVLAYLKVPEDERQRWVVRAFGYLVLAAFTSLLIFRLFQPYAFTGPGFFGLKPNPQWVANIIEQRNQAAGDVDFPPALQWARRPIWFSFQNLTIWGLGLPLGLLAWAGFLWAGWRIFKRDWQQHLLLWGWTALYFTWQTTQFNPTMRYQLPIYPTLAIFAAWAVIALFDYGQQLAGSASRRSKVIRWIAILLGDIVLLVTAFYAIAFANIYQRPITRVEASYWIYQNIAGPINLEIQTVDGPYRQVLSFPYATEILPGRMTSITFTAKASGVVEELSLAHVLAKQAEQELTLKFSFSPNEEEGLPSTAVFTGKLAAGADGRGQSYTLQLDPPLQLVEGQLYLFDVELDGGMGIVSLQGSGLVNEGDWDDGLPLRVEGYDAFGGIYPTDLEFNMYWDDNQEKLERFLRIYDQADYIVISSNRQWGTLTRLPERFPMSTLHYRHLLGCPEDKEIIWCYRVAEPGMFQGDLGFELVQTFQSNPTFGPFKVNDQFAEEAFTVYDHPKVLIFRKTSDYDPLRARQILEQADLNHIVRVTPKKAASFPGNLMLPDDRLAEQQAGGTWSEIFNPQALQNRFQPLGVVLWYLSVFFLGLLVYPLLRLALPSLADRGYPLARIAGMLLFSYLAWLAGSFRIPVTRLTLGVVLLIIVLFSVFLTYRQRGALQREWNQRWKYFLVVEGLALTCFLAFLFIRLGNPDLWHPWYGGEKPMDFAYFNAVLKSTTFPPYDPWYAGGYLNYYYFGFVLVGMPVKLLGLMPSFAYNLILPSFFSMLAIGAFSIGYNLSTKKPHKDVLMATGENEAIPAEAIDPQPAVRHLPYIVGLAASLGVTVLGNLGTLRQILRALQQLGVQGGLTEITGFFTRVIGTFTGLVKLVGGEALPVALGNWYWIPSRAIPAPEDVEPITEFPMFTFLYADPHAHMWALPVTVLALAWVISVIKARGKWRGILAGGLGFFLGGLAIGALRPTNTWDIFVYLALGVVALLYTGLRWLNVDAETFRGTILQPLPVSYKRWLLVLGEVLLLIGLSLLLYQPYAQWYALGYTKLRLWDGANTPSGSYLIHWGVFLFIIVSWMIWETRQWMADTPLVSLRKLEKYRGLIVGGVVLILGWTIILVWMEAYIAWLVLPLAAWAAMLLLRPGLSDLKRGVLFMVGTGLVLTVVVELVVLVGDIGRMNTVFKFYLQVWTLFAISAAAAFGWLLESLNGWKPGWRAVWQAAVTFLVFSALLFSGFATQAKIKDRMTHYEQHRLSEATPPLTLDGMQYMQYSKYYEPGPNDTPGTDIDLSQDYRMIRWIQDNIQGSPFIVEAVSRNNYRWYSRVSINTGLPAVVGWEWHQQQQRAVNPGEWVTERVLDVSEFYTTTDTASFTQFLRQYGVSYIILGQLERTAYPGQGLEKFADFNGVLWREVYRDGDNVIYQVLK